MSAVLELAEALNREALNHAPPCPDVRSRVKTEAARRIREAAAKDAVELALVKKQLDGFLDAWPEALRNERMLNAVRGIVDAHDPRKQHPGEWDGESAAVGDLLTDLRAALEADQ